MPSQCQSVFLSGRNVTPTLKGIGELSWHITWNYWVGHCGIVSSTDIVYWHCFIVTSFTGIVSSWHRVLALFHRDIVYWHCFIVTSCTGIVSSWHRVLALFHRDIVYWHCFIVTSCTGIVSSWHRLLALFHLLLGLLVQNKRATNMRIIFLCSLSMVVTQIMIACNTD